MDGLVTIMAGAARFIDRATVEVLIVRDLRSE